MIVYDCMGRAPKLHLSTRVSLPMRKVQVSLLCLNCPLDEHKVFPAFLIAWALKQKVAFPGIRTNIFQRSASLLGELVGVDSRPSKALGFMMFIG